MITVTSKAEQFIKHHVQNVAAAGISVNLNKTGCAGQSYQLTFVDDINQPNNHIHPCDGFNVYVPHHVMARLGDLKLDLVRNGLNEELAVFSSRETDRCGCGKTFNIEEGGL